MSEKISLNYHFLEPLYKVLEHSSFTRKCPKHSDQDFLEAGLSRSLSQVASGRDFLQLGFHSPGNSWKISTYFESLKSTRRASLVLEVAAMLAGGVRNSHSAWQWPADLPELDGFEIFAGDGHFHKAATHDPKGPKGRLVPVGQFFARDMRSGALHHLDITVPAEGNTGEHDMHMLKRKAHQALRLGTRKGRKVLYVWDRAGIDYSQWYNWKQASGIYFLSRAKDNMIDNPIGENNWDRTDPRNHGVVADTMNATSAQVTVRWVTYIDPVSGDEFHFVTNLPAGVPPGIVAWLYQRRWDIEKAFDETRNRLGEGKAWASSPTAKLIQGAFISIAYNLLLLMEDRLRAAGDLPPDVRQEQKRKRRHKKAIRKARDAGREISYYLQGRPRCSQMGCKFIRWLKRHVTGGSSYAEAVANLRAVYKEFS